MEKLEQLIEKHNKIQNKIREIENKKLIEISLPKLRKSVGKCFKYENRGGEDKSWPLYFQIVGINEKDMSFRVKRFQISGKGYFEGKLEDVYNFHGESYFRYSDYVEIPKSEYERARKKFVKILNEIFK